MTQLVLSEIVAFRSATMDRAIFSLLFIRFSFQSLRLRRETRNYFHFFFHGKIRCAILKMGQPLPELVCWKLSGV